MRAGLRAHAGRLLLMGEDGGLSDGRIHTDRELEDQYGLQQKSCRSAKHFRSLHLAARTCTWPCLTPEAPQRGKHQPMRGGTNPPCAAGIDSGPWSRG